MTPLIVDCFPLFNELDILEWRLTELYGAVDWFVIVESTHTHKGDVKPLHYATNRQRFAQWNDKVIHIVIDEDTDNDSIAAIRRREMAQRNAILMGLQPFADKPDTTVLVSDVDEIPRREIVESLRGNVLPDGAVIQFIHTLYYYNFNTSAPKRLWPGTRAARLADVKAMSPHIIRNAMGQPDGLYPKYGHLMNAGWHCSYFGGTERIQQKMASFLHQELVSDENSASATIEERVKQGVDIWGRENEQEFVIGPAGDLPWAVRTDIPRWKHYFSQDWQPDFHERWYEQEQAARVGWIAQQIPAEGVCLEIGCWEGKSSIAIAQSIAPRTLHCIDHWKGNVDEGDQMSIDFAKERDIAATFAQHMERFTAGNVEIHRMDWRDYTFEGPIAFAHIDGSHDYKSVADCLHAILPHLKPGAILCGDDLYHDGVYRALHDIFGDEVQDLGGRLWVWQKTEGLSDVNRR